jgi:hypothetical protein
VLEQLYEVHRDAPDAHISVSNRLRAQLARTLARHRNLRKKKDSGSDPEFDYRGRSSPS